VVKLVSIAQRLMRRSQLISRAGVGLRQINRRKMELFRSDIL
jgi:hypothetical protein